MGKVIAFRKPERVISEQERLKALVRGNIDVYICENCHDEFEVINEKFPEMCPHCGAVITSWIDEDNE